MKIKIERAGVGPKYYTSEDELKPNSFYEDADGGVYWTDGDGYVSSGVWKTDIVDAESISWPLLESNVKSVTISK